MTVSMFIPPMVSWLISHTPTCCDIFSLRLALLRYMSLMLLASMVSRKVSWKPIVVLSMIVDTPYQ